jgi:predicted ribonuclease YlaK
MPLAVVDTNVLLVLSDQLQGYDWHGVMGEKQDLQILVTIPMAVVDELDRLKRDRTPMKLNGKSPTRRSLAIQALRTLDEMFPDPRRMFSIEQPTEPIGQRVLFRILLEEPGHKRLPSVDAEVVDQTVALTAFGGRVKLITFDTGMRLRARAADLEARQLPDPEDD